MESESKPVKLKFGGWSQYSAEASARNVAMQTITAIFEDGVLKPGQPLNLAEHAQVRITVEPLEPNAQKAEKLAALEALWRITRRHSEHLTREALHERR